ncbi:TIGR03086 family metal-binding protein [Actinomadura litoris]|uniref:TIGR03086 family protein n=1 Tax=Actinomadura litoris TaxID=2678616 RepID=A0A7K1KWY5_9ACTN|nr:TIGR03086 family metal-binding protein [Actinomadura litoris]MUN36485.1 TIGR03086 family protein [Actinomadura litoris]
MTTPNSTPGTGLTTGWDLLDAAHAALLGTVRRVPAGAWTRPTPCAEWNVAQVVQHAAGDQLAFAAAITGGPGPDFNPFAPDGVIDGAPADLLEPMVAACAAAWATVGADAESVPVPVPPHALPPAVGAGAAALDAAVHAWDVARATGQPSPLTPGLAVGLLDVARQIVEPLRRYGAYAPAIEGAGDDETALLHYLGRDPHWTA